MDRPTPARPVLHRATDVARLLDCSEWWVKEQARNRRIPYSWIGGSYRFTDQHIVEIVRRFEVLPTEDLASSAVASHKFGFSKEDGAQVVQLKARTPRRARNAASGVAA
jgi:hypothetical protein